MPLSSQEYVLKRQSQVLCLLSLDVVEKGLYVDSKDLGLTSGALWAQLP